MDVKSETINSIQQVAVLAAGQAIEAYCDKTFSVGGLLVSETGVVIHKMHNRVLDFPVLSDPTAHGERQLIDWYYQQKAAGNKDLPEPSKISVVTSLDPCCMCTGAILTAGFHVATVAMDDTSGINYDKTATFEALPEELREAAKKTFSYPAVGGSSCLKRAKSGADVIFPKGDAIIDEQTAALCEVIFDDTLQTVRSEINHDCSPSAPMAQI